MMTPRSYLYSRRQSPPQPPNVSHANNPTTSTSLFSRRSWKNDQTSNKKHNTNSPRTPGTAVGTGSDIMGRRERLVDGLSPPSRTQTSTTVTNTNAFARTNTHSSAVQIPVKPKQETAHKHKTRYHTDSPRKHSHSSSHHSRARDAGSPDSIPSSVATLLAVTNIPPPVRRGRSGQRSTKGSRMTVDSIVPRSQISEKVLSQELDEDLSLPSLGRGSPMDVLLSPPDRFEEDEVSVTSESAFTSNFSTRVGSLESVPSLVYSPGASTLPSVDSPVTPRGGKFRQPRRSLEPVSSPPGEKPADPLSRHDVDRLDFTVFNPAPLSIEKKESAIAVPFRSVFKSNLTASLRALRSAARSISSFTASSIPPEDFLTRSILTIDPRVPFTDERMPPVWEEEPSEAMRRYLNPTSNLCAEPRSILPTRSYTASIQMRTYKVQRSKSAISTTGRQSSQSNASKSSTEVIFSPGPRQREMRENSDFIRIAVMEHLMRKRGKLDDQREGHARWLLPPRKSSAKPYEIGSDGVPLRWASAIVADD